MNAKESSENLKTLILDKSKLESSGDQLRVVVLECFLFKTRKSLEHLKKFVESY